MNHIDEGTIHGWLDGALDAGQAREVEAHVAQCASCSAAVAEARGFIAGASRILIALDDVPAGVTPKSTPKRTPAFKRQWRAAPWVTGIAAALILAIGVTQMNTSGERTVPPKDAASNVAPVVPPQDLQRQAAAPPVAAPLDARAMSDQQAKAAGALSSVRAPSIRRDARQTQVATAGAGEGSAGAEMKSEAALVATAPMSAKRSAADEATRGLRPAESAKLQLSEVAVAAASPQRLSTESDRDERLAGCYKVGEASVQRRLLPSADALRRAGAPATSAPAAPARERADFAAAVVPWVVRLDSLRSALGFEVRSQQNDSVIGTWQRLHSDSARIELRGGMVFTVGRGNRVACPQR